MCSWRPKKAEGRCFRPVTTAWCYPCSSCCCPMTSLSIPSQSYSEWLLSSSWCSSCWLGQPPIPQVQRDHHPDSCVLCTQHLLSCLGHELTLEKFQQLCLDRWTSNAVCIPETSGSAVLLFLQTDCHDTGRPTLLPGLFMAAQGVHASPKVTACHTDECLSFLIEALQGGLALCTRKQVDFPRSGLGQLCSYKFSCSPADSVHSACLVLTSGRSALSFLPCFVPPLLSADSGAHPSKFFDQPGPTSPHLLGTTLQRLKMQRVLALCS